MRVFDTDAFCLYTYVTPCDVANSIWQAWIRFKRSFYHNRSGKTSTYRIPDNIDSMLFYLPPPLGIRVAKQKAKKMRIEDYCGKKIKRGLLASAIAIGVVFVLSLTGCVNKPSVDEAYSAECTLTT